MANPVTNPSPGGYWGVIQSAASEKLTTAALWEKIGAFEQAQGITRPAGLFQAVSSMRSLAVSQRIASTNLINAADDVAITASMIAQDIYARPLDQQALAPTYRIRFEANVLTAEGESTRWLTVVNRGYLPATKGDLIDTVTMAGLDMSTGYGAVFTGLTGNVSIVAA